MTAAVVNAVRALLARPVGPNSSVQQETGAEMAEMPVVEGKSETSSEIFPEVFFAEVQTTVAQGKRVVTHLEPALEPACRKLSVLMGPILPSAPNPRTAEQEKSAVNPLISVPDFALRKASAQEAEETTRRRKGAKKEMAVNRGMRAVHLPTAQAVADVLVKQILRLERLPAHRALVLVLLL